MYNICITFFIFLSLFGSKIILNKSKQIKQFFIYINFLTEYCRNRESYCARNALLIRIINNCAIELASKPRVGLINLDSRSKFIIISLILTSVIPCGERP